MEPAKIDWKSIEWKFVEDHVYEHFNAPKWVDFSSPGAQREDDQPRIDELWFCRPDCNHPKTVQDFYKSPSSSKLLSSLVNLPDILECSPNRRGDNLKRRGGNQAQASNRDSKCCYTADSENTNPNTLNTPITHQVKSMKEAAIKSKWSTEKKIFANDSNATAHSDETPRRRLKSTRSARNLFAGKDILNHITDFCNELKKLATREKGRENERAENTLKTPEVDESKHKKKVMDEDVLSDKEKERKPLLEVVVVSKEKSAAMDKSYCRGEAFRRKRGGADEAENIPTISLDLKKMDNRNLLLHIRTSPPTPQCFSAVHGPARTPPPASKTTKEGMSLGTDSSQERNILEEVNQCVMKGATKKDEILERRKSSSKNVHNFAEKEAKALDVFWFLKPCPAEPLTEQVTYPWF